MSFCDIDLKNKKIQIEDGNCMIFCESEVVSVLPLSRTKMIVCLSNKSVVLVDAFQIVKNISIPESSIMAN